MNRLRRMLERLFRQANSAGAAGREESERIYRERAADEAMSIDRLHSRAPVEDHLDILFADARIGTLDFLQAYRASVNTSATEVRSWKGIRRAQRAYNLMRYFDRSLGLRGERVECGVYRGLTASLCANVARMRDPAFDGRGLYLVDSFEGLGPGHPADAIGKRVVDGGQVERSYGFAPGDFGSTSAEHVAAAMADFPGVKILKGWIPEVLALLPETRWAFVHLDLDLYEPTLECMQYFFPRLCPGAIVVNDDYASPFFPGAGRAWSEFCKERELPYVVLDTGQAVLVETGAVPQPAESSQGAAGSTESSP